MSADVSPITDLEYQESAHAGIVATPEYATLSFFRTLAPPPAVCDEVMYGASFHALFHGALFFREPQQSRKARCKTQLEDIAPVKLASLI